jgi:hypothetical protein
MNLEHKSLQLFGKQFFEKTVVQPLLIAILLVTNVSAQQLIDGEKLEVLESKVVVRNSHEAVWDALSSFGNVSKFHTTIDDSMSLNGTTDKAKLGVEREVQIPDGINNIINKERIVTFIDGVYYTYEVYESENFPIKKMLITYGVRIDSKGRTILFSKTFYKLNNGLSTKFLKRKLKRFGMDSLLAYKYYIETGERNTDIKILRKRYHHEDEEHNNVYAAVKN